MIPAFCAWAPFDVAFALLGLGLTAVAAGIVIGLRIHQQSLPTTTGDKQ